MQRPSVFSAALLFVLTLPALGQGYPQTEVFTGYSHFGATILGQSFSANGGIGSVAFNPKPWLGGVGEVGVYNGGLTPPVNGTSTGATFLFGPRFSARANERFTPFAQALFGGIHMGTSQFVGEEVTSTTFAMAFGGGLDVKLNKPMAVRLVQVDWLRSHFHGVHTTNNWQDSARISAGVVFRLSGE